MIRSFSKKIAMMFAIAVLPASAAMAQVNGWKTNARVFNDFTTSTLNITNPNTNPGTIVIDDRNFTDDGVGGNFANRHDVMASKDNGATAFSFPITEGFTISANVSLSVGSTAPRKEAGFRINSPVTGDMLFLVNSDAGEIVTFGGGGPFHSFSSGAQPDYVPGTTILMGFTYTPGSGGNPGTTEYFINRGSGLETTGPLAWSNLEGGPVNFNVGVYGQFSPSLANPQDFGTATFGNLSIVPIPEPASLGLLALGGAMAMVRRRK